jgi:hypothetical protein
MQERVDTKNSLLRKVIAVASLPLLTFIWMTGWTLTIIGEKFEVRESNQKTLKNHPKFETQNNEIETLDNDTKINYEQPITA